MINVKAILKVWLRKVLPASIYRYFSRMRWNIKKNDLKIYFCFLILFPYQPLRYFANLVCYIFNKEYNVLDEYMIRLTNAIINSPVDSTKYESLEDYQKWEMSQVQNQFWQNLFTNKCFSQNTKLIDIGCGIGGKTVALSNHFGFASVGIDLDKRKLVHAQKLAEEYNVECLFIHSDAVNIPVNDNTFDVAISITVFEHLYDVESVLKEVYRVLKPNGIVVINYHFYQARYGAHFHQYIRFPWPQYFWGINSLVDFWNKKVEIASWHGKAGFFGKNFTLEQISHDHYFSLNKMNSINFEKIIQKTNFEILSNESSLEPIVNVFPFLKKINSIRDFVKGSRLYILRKKC